jgi:MFS family permease
MLTSGAAGDRYGHKRVVLTASVSSASAPWPAVSPRASGVLVAARVVQGVGAALRLPGTLALTAANTTAGIMNLCTLGTPFVLMLSSSRCSTARPCSRA